MGGNRIYQVFEETVIALYYYNLLTPELLDKVATICASEFIHPEDGGQLESDDGKHVDQICVETLYPDYVPPPLQREEEDGTHERENWEEKFNEIRKERWKWVA